ncbi:MAG TPA: hypothetical protein DHV62_05465 [Elusimicrobia bacterium]|jgi:radical SAM superfamily enzyme YgiQ (UPF0313 family)|nr:hypothetical protein [Elusimicrobiota bacterium]
MKILLIFPPKKHWALREMPIHKGLDVEAGFYPPLGILSVAAYLQKYSGHEVKVIDSVAEELDYPSLEKRIEEEKPEIVGIYTCTEYLYDAIFTARTVKKVAQEIKVVLGGPHTYIYPPETIAIPEVDYTVLGEGEIVFHQLVERISKGELVSNLPGVLTKGDGEKKLEIQKISNLDDLPFPARDLVPYQKYRSILARKNPITTMMTSRGCPYNCHFCNSIERGKKPRYRSAKNVVAEIQECVEKFAIYDFLFFDEMFTSNRQRAIEICKEILGRELKIRWHCRSRADVLDKELVEKMKKAGCRLIQFGIESGSEHIQKVLNKKLNLKKVAETIKMVRQAEILTYADFMLFNPEENERERMETLEFAKKLNLDYAAFGIFQPLPDTEFYFRGLREGGIRNDYWSDYVKSPQSAISTYWWPGDYTAEEMGEFNLYAYRNFYFRPKYAIQRLLRPEPVGQMLWRIKGAIKVFLLRRG